MGKKILQSCRSDTDLKHNRCVIFADNANMGITAKSLERKENCWFIQSNISSDLIVYVGGSSFHLHKLPMVSRSGYLNKLVFETSNRDLNSPLNIHLQKLHGGPQIFELVVKFCYGLAFDLTATNVAPLYCAAHVLEMYEDTEQENLLSKTEAFLSYTILTSWKYTFRILKSCEYVSSWAKKLSIVKRCSESIAWKASLDLQTIDTEYYDQSNNKKHQVIVDNWWYEDISFLRIDHFVEVINGLKSKGMKSRLVGGCIIYWTSKWLSKFKLGADFDQKEIQRLTTETLIRILPKDHKSVSFNFLLHLLKLGLLLKSNDELIVELERRLALNLENCCVGDLVVKNYKSDRSTVYDIGVVIRVGDLVVKNYKSDHSTVYDIGLVIRVVENYIHYLPSIPLPRMGLVANVVDEYLQLVARDENLSVEIFKLLAKALPGHARHCDDKLYRAIDMYFKAHPRLTEEERKGVCRTMEYQKLSQEARNHAMKNGRLPKEIIGRFILLEQVDMNAAILSNRSNKERSQFEATITVRGSPSKGLARRNKELNVMKEKVEKMTVKLGDLHGCRVELQKQVKVGIV